MMGGRICVRCQPYGRLVVPLGGRPPLEWARRVLAIIVRSYHKRQADERARQAREAARLGRRARARTPL